jgi:hypothetical protein
MDDPLLAALLERLLALARRAFFFLRFVRGGAFSCRICSRATSTPSSAVNLNGKASSSAWMAGSMPGRVVVGSAMASRSRLKSSLRPAVVEDDFDEVVADECRIEMCQHVGVDVAERAAGTVPVAVGERLQDAAFEIGPGMRGCDGAARLFGQVVAADAKDVGLDSGGD